MPCYICMHRFSSLTKECVPASVRSALFAFMGGPYSFSRSPHLVVDPSGLYMYGFVDCADSQGCLSSPFLVLTSHPSLSPPPRKAEGGKATATAGPAELPPEYLTSPLSQQSQVVVQETVSEAMATQQLEVVFLRGD